jgi:hypothetical protein
MSERTCSVIEDGKRCEGVTGVPGTARGLCSKHYNRWLRHGDPLVQGLIVGDDEARFWSKVDKRGPDECWPWTTGQLQDGYGAFAYTDAAGRCIRLGAHRWLAGHLRASHLGPGEEACHHCDNPPCCNPDHIYIGDHAQNMADREARGRGWQQQVTHCPQGHEYTPENTLYRSDGRRKCRQCGRDAARRRQAAMTHCKNGHALEGDNVIIVKNGKRKCRICEEVRAAAASVRQREVWAERSAATG